MCPYDTRGVLRPGFQFVAYIFETSVNALDIPDFRDIETDGLGYEPADSLNQVQPDGHELLQKAIPDYQHE